MEPQAPAAASNPLFVGPLPIELALTCLSHLDARSLCRAQRVSTSWRGLAADDNLWKNLSTQTFGNVAVLSHGTKTWKGTFEFCVKRCAIITGTPQCKPINNISSICSFCDDEITVIVDKSGKAHILDTKSLKELQTLDLKLEEEVLKTRPERVHIAHHGNYVGFVFYTKLGDAHTYRMHMRIWDRAGAKICLTSTERIDYCWDDNLFLYQNYAIKRLPDANVIKILNLTDGKEKATLDFSGHSFVFCDRFAMTCSGVNNGVYDVEKGEYVKFIEGASHYFSGYRLGNTLILSKVDANQYSVEIWDINRWERLKVYPVGNFHCGPYIPHAEDDILMLVDRPTSFQFLDRITGNLKPLQSHLNQQRQPVFGYKASLNGTKICYLQRHQQLIFAGSDYGKIYIFDAINGRQVHCLVCPGEHCKMYSMIVQDGKVIAHTNNGIFEWTFAPAPKPSGQDQRVQGAASSILQFVATSVTKLWG